MEKSIERLSKIADINLVSLKNSLSKDQRIADLIVIVKDKISSLPINISYKSNTDLVLYVCKLVENVIFKKDKVDKKEIVISILRPVLGLSEIEIKIVEDIIEFLHSNNLIQKIKKSKKISSWFQKKSSCIL